MSSSAAANSSRMYGMSERSAVFSMLDKYQQDAYRNLMHIADR